MEEVPKNKIVEFKEWRSKYMKKYNELCPLINEDLIENISEVKIILDNYPKCLVKFTKQMCKCDQDCLEDSFIGINFDTTCHRIDYDNLFISQNYLPCKMFNVRVVDGVMYDIDGGNLPNNTKESIQNSIYDLCFNHKNSFDNLKCAAYELQDSCGDDKKCLNLRFRPVLLKDCLNPDFEDQIKEIEEIVGFPKINVTFEDLQGIIRLPRSSGEYISQDNNIDLVSSTGLCVSAMIISILGFLAYKVFRKNSNKDTNLNEIDTKV